MMKVKVKGWCEGRWQDRDGGEEDNEMEGDRIK